MEPALCGTTRGGGRRGGLSTARPSWSPHRAARRVAVNGAVVCQRRGRHGACAVDKRPRRRSVGRDSARAVRGGWVSRANRVLSRGCIPSYFAFWRVPVLLPARAASRSSYFPPGLHPVLLRVLASSRPTSRSGYFPPGLVPVLLPVRATSRSGYFAARRCARSPTPAGSRTSAPSRARDGQAPSTSGRSFA
jgi:hypothetical protein